MANDSTRAVAAVVETELNYALRLAVEAGMYEAGKHGENKDVVEENLRNHFNQRIGAGWSYSNFENIYVPLSDENSLVLVWLPDGSLWVHGHLDASFTHVMGARAYGVKLDAGVVPRYGRMWYIANYVYDNYIRGRDMDESARAALQDNLNENYACEYLRFTIRQAGLTVYDTYAGRAIAEND